MPRPGLGARTYDASISTVLGPFFLHIASNVTLGSYPESTMFSRTKKEKKKMAELYTGSGFLELGDDEWMNSPRAGS